MKGFKEDIEELAQKNNDFRRVLYTGHNVQLVLMSLKPGEEIGMEVHPDNDQFFRFEEGQGKVVVDENEYEVEDDDVVIVPAGAAHNVVNTAEDEDLKLYTLYSPPHHKDGIIRTTKEEAESQEAPFDGATSE
jgi:mannose-6-phosphate isomerase-like protein (cupin superfamily)